MSHREWKFRVFDILESVQAIQRYTSGMDFAAFSNDDKTVDAVIRRLEIIGEAARHIPEDIAQRFPQIPWNKMRGLRNVVAHEYFGVSIPVIWETVATDIPALGIALKTISENITPL